MSEVLTLGDVADIVAGVGFPKDMQGGQDGAIPVFKVGDISAAWLQGKSLLNDSRNYLSAEEAKSLGKCVPAGATVFAKIGEALRLNRRVMLGRDALVDNNVMGLVPKRERVAPKYLYYFMQTVDLGELSRSTTVPSIRKSDVVEISIPVPAIAVQDEIVAELEKQFSRLDEAVASLQRVKANLKRYERATIQSLTNPESFAPTVTGSIADIAISLDNMRKPVNKTERAKRPGSIPYLGANGPTGTIDKPLFDEELVLVVEDETFVGRTAPFSYYFSGECWVNNHTHVLRARPDIVLAEYLNLALSYYPFIPLTTGSTGRRKLTKAALMAAQISVPSLADQTRIVAEFDRHLSIIREVETEADANLQRSQTLRQAMLSSFFRRAVS